MNDVKQVDRDAAQSILWVDTRIDDVEHIEHAFKRHRIAAEAETAKLSLATIDRQATEIAALQARVAELVGAIAAFCNNHQGHTTGGIDELDALRTITWKAGLFDDQKPNDKEPTQ